ncbi:hypothetical protein [uncultured Bradyrhizobium sp.]|uniref:hypothetical protein n=1 Tax=uncultured Bradyrhizobium sp. TaxID=199684 RepID=UPI0035CA6A89
MIAQITKTSALVVGAAVTLISEGSSGLISRRSAIRILGLGALLVGARLAVDFTSAAAYVYPEYDFGQFWLAFLLFIGSLLVVVILAFVRFFQRRFIESLIVLALLCMPFSFREVVDRHYWKFRIHKSDYQSAVQNETGPSPKYRVFNWGNRNTHLWGGGYIIEGIVYDESDEVALPLERRSFQWINRRAHPSSSDRWVTTLPERYPACKRIIKPLGEHFYYLSEEC